MILASIAIALGLASLYVVTMPSTYTSTSAVLLSPGPGNPLTAEASSAGVVQMTVALETEAQIVRTPAVADVVSDALGRLTPDTGESLEVTVPSNTQILEISFTAGTPERAMAGAQAFADGYLSFRAERSRAVQESRIARLDEQIGETDASLRAAIGAESASGGSVYESQQVQLLADRLAQLSNSRSTEESIGTDPGAVVNAAPLPEDSNQLPAWLYLAVGFVLGAIAGLGIGLLREWRRDLLRESDDATELGVPVLAAIRPMSGTELAVDAGSAIHESYRRLRTALIANGPRPYVLAVTGVNTDLSAQVATNLALVLAEARFSVLLITTDSQERSVEGLLGLRGGEGLAEVVLSGLPAKDLLVTNRGISVLTAGHGVGSSDDLTATTAFRATVKELHRDFDYVIIAAAVAGSADGDAALLAADSALLVLAPGATTRTLLGATLDRLERLGVKTIGAVNITRPEMSASAGLPATVGVSGAQPQSEVAVSTNSVEALDGEFERENRDAELDEIGLDDAGLDDEELDSVAESELDDVELADSDSDEFESDSEDFDDESDEFVGAESDPDDEFEPGEADAVPDDADADQNDGRVHAKSAG